MPAGWHLPLHNDNEVLVSCLNNDPDRPMLVGTLANPANQSVVTSKKRPTEPYFDPRPERALYGRLADGPCHHPNGLVFFLARMMETRRA